MRTVLTLAGVAMASLALTTTSANAGLVLYEGFDYAAGDIDGSQACGTGFSATGWTTSCQGAPKTTQ